MARTAVWVAILALDGWAQQQQQQPSMDWSAEKEAALGRSLTQEFRRREAPVEDAELTRYLTSLTKRIAPESAANPELTRNLEAREATPLPGGALFVPLGALAAATTESALAGVIAHGLAHAELGHLKPQRLDSGRIPLWLPMHGPGVLIPLGFAPYQRRNEAAADRRAAELLSRAGFDPQGYAAYVETLTPTAVNLPGERLEEIRQAPRPSESFSSGEFDAARERARAMVKAWAPAASERRQRWPPTLRRTR